jgi:hypothetical protein
MVWRFGDAGRPLRTLRQSGYNGVPLTDLTAFSYSTYATRFGTGGQAPYVDLKIDYTGDGQADDTLTFEPINQTQTVALNSWQTWDALSGRWWSDNAGGPPPFYTLLQYIAAHSGAKIVNTATGGVRLAAGCGGVAWTNFVGYADNLTIGVHGSSNTFDFEPTVGPGPTPSRRVAICHKGHTIRIDQHALRAHLKHGDHLGPC